MTPPKICLIHPGHVLSTAWVWDGYNKYLQQMGCEIMDVRTDKLISFASQMVECMPDKLEGTQGATSEKWKLHLSQQMMLNRVMECQAHGADVILAVCGKLMSMQNYEIFDLIPGNKVVLLTESPYEDSTQRYYARFYDFAFVNDKYSVDTIGFVTPSTYMPHGYDPEIYHPDEQDQEVDVSFIGTPFSNRKPILDDVREKIPSHFIFDATTEKVEGSDTPMIAFVPPDQSAKVYHRSKVNLNIHRTESFFGNKEYINARGAYSLGPRAFEIAGCAAFQLCDNTRPELTAIFGDTVATYDAPEEVVERIQYWADPARDALRRDMALASYEIAQQHTYAARSAQLVGQLAKWYNRPDWLEQENHEQSS